LITTAHYGALINLLWIIILSGSCP
jgi:hypothetical protein